MPKSILLIKDNPDDEALALRALRKLNFVNQVFVARDGAETPGFLFARGTYANCKVHELSAVILFDLKLPQVDR